MTFKVGDRVQFPLSGGLQSGWIVSDADTNMPGVCFDLLVRDGHTAKDAAPDGRGYWCIRDRIVKLPPPPPLLPGTKVRWRGPRSLAGYILPGAEGVVTRRNPLGDMTNVMVDWVRHETSADQWELDVIAPLPAIVSATHHLQQLTAQAEQLIEEDS
ncbi:hypothetical protein UFOVP706_32 [uncultured Caudovirales phage]|uniref:Uncharacterized protein n=1 Tax=uncultured Caudovirales phage TaxID=2100421 RepID=A0A6J5NIM9_9CAUD|nr:hypothetical protein UFOVP706_32 [uncultured Caudovirales phage]